MLVGTALALSFSAAAGTFTRVCDSKATAWADVNNDGWPDMVGKTSVWLNNRDNTFAKSDPFPNLWLISLGDYNNDGRIDVIGYNDGEHGANGLRLYANTADGWKDESAKAKTTDVLLISRGMSLGDFNGDGFLDAFISGWCDPWQGSPEDDHIYLNDGNGGFKQTWKSPQNQLGRGVMTIDFDEDGDLDIYVSNYWMTPTQLWRNDGFDGNGGLTDVAATYGLLDGPGHTMGSTAGDFNNDGHFDIFICNFAHPGNPPLRFMENMGPQGDFHFRDRGQGGITQIEPFASATTADIDNDGRLDVLIATTAGYAPPNQPQLYRNLGGWRFANVTAKYGLGGLAPGMSAAWADFDRDGYLDVVVDGGLWRNPGGSHHFLKINLEGGRSGHGRVNRTALGAQVRLRHPKLSIISRQVEGNTGQSPQNDQTLHFGLGSFAGPVDIEILWPGGETQMVSGLAVDRLHAVTVSDED